MSLAFRAFIWFGLYLALVLLPLAVALGAGPGGAGLAAGFVAGLGLSAFAVIVLEFALVSRLRAASEPFGTDALMLFHRLMGIGALLAVAAHVALALLRSPSAGSLNPLRLQSPLGSGALALWLLAALVLVSVWRRRLRLSYEAWQTTHALGAVLIVAASLDHALRLGSSSAAMATRVVLCGYVAALALLLMRYRLLRPWLLRKRPWEVVANRDEGASTRTLGLRPVGHAGLGFRPGQFAWVSTAGSPLALEQHPLSLAGSAESGEERCIEFSVKAQGDWSSQRVPALRAGDRVWVDGPYGAFTPDRVPGMGFVLISGGSGVAPMRSMLLTLRDRGDRRPVLHLHGANRPERMAYLGELRALQEQMNLDFVPVFEEPPAGWTGERGLVTQELLARRLPLRRNDYQYFVCGPVPMMTSVERSLLELGVELGRVHTERFDMV